MNLFNKPFLVFLPFLALFASFVVNHSSASPVDAPKDDVSPVLAALEAVARSETPALKAYARRFGEVLAHQSVGVPKAILDLAPAAPGAAELGDQDRTRVQALEDRASNFFDQRYPPAEDAPPSRARVEWLTAKAEAFPDVAIQMDSLYRLIMLAIDPRRSANVDYAAAAKAMDAALARWLEACAGNPSDETLNKLAPMTLGPLAQYLFLKGVGMAQPTKEAFDKILDDVGAKAAAAAQTAKHAKAVELLQRMATHTKELQRITANGAEMAVTYKEVSRLTAAIIDALGKKDLKAAGACCTPETAALLLSGPPAGSILVLPAGAKETRLVAVRLMAGTDETHANMYVFLDAVFATGEVKRVGKQAAFTKTDPGWRLTELPKEKKP
jgi:hypothetical protein